MIKNQQDKPKGIEKKQWDIMVKYTEGFGYMILYLSILCIVFLMIQDIV